MIVTLKPYQTDVLTSLEDFFTTLTAEAATNKEALSAAFAGVTRKQRGLSSRYYPVLQMPNVPYICLRVPTGGGKTLIACHALQKMQSFIRSDAPFVVWLAPSGQIVEQTLRALRKKQHPYRKALDEHFAAVEVVDIDEALQLSPAKVRSGAVILVSTIQAFRQEKKDGRRVYESNGALYGHFQGLSGTEQERLMRNETTGLPEYSLANLLRLHRPLVIVDEAHNSRTGLSFTALERIQPSCIVELTATPDRTLDEKKEHYPSNVLVSVSASALNAAAMIKMPLRIATHEDWQTVLANAKAKLDALSEAAAQETDYLRPIMLIKAHSAGGDATPEIVKQKLQADFGVAEAEISIATGQKNDLAGVDLLEKTCPVRFVITIDKLREGWDCPFASVLCTLSEVRSKTAVEQLVGRVLRMPYAHRRRNDALNSSYAYSVGNKAFLLETLTAYTDALQEEGFDPIEAKQLVVYGEGTSVTQDLPSLFSEASGSQESVLSSIIEVCEEAPNLEALSEELRPFVSYDADSQTLTIDLEKAGDKNIDDIEASIGKVFKAQRSGTVIAQLQRRVAQAKAQRRSKLSPAERGEIFRIPGLAVQISSPQGNFLQLLDEGYLLETMKIDLQASADTLTEAEFPQKEHGIAEGIVKLTESGKLTYGFLEEIHAQQTSMGDWSRWTENTLALWLDNHLQNRQAFAKSETLDFIRVLIKNLQKERSFSFEELAKRKYELIPPVQQRLIQHLENAKTQVFEDLFGMETVTVRDDASVCFSQPDNTRLYEYSTPYQGRYGFKHHFYPIVGDLDEGNQEEQWAVALDNHTSVDCWLRNIPRKPYSFRLPYSHEGKVRDFYPDFICKLKDGRYAVVEPHGKHLADFAAKERVGRVWAERSNKTCVFVMATPEQIGILQTAFS